MKKLLLLLLCVPLIGVGQSVIRENIGSNGASKTINNIHLNQSVGQQSALNGTVSNNDIILRQGFQQPVFRIEKNTLIDVPELDLVVFPNPFRYDISVKFDKEPSEKIDVLVFDVMGKLIKEIDFDPLIEITIPCKELARGSYLLNIRTSNQQYSANIIKQ